MVQLGLRERKKIQMRADIVAAAERLFTKHGFDNVTIPQVAEEVGVSVKTIFNYFRLKEDLAFASEDQICIAWVHHIRQRRANQTPFEAVREQILSSLADADAIEEVLSFQALVDSSRVLQMRQRLVWDRLESAVAKALALELGSDPGPLDPSARYMASQLVSVLRLLYSTEMREHLEAVAPDDRASVLAAWLDDVVDLVQNGVGDRMRRDASG
ncbi:MAG: TetR/AcrR family transcriptional regulator [Acidimicrobiia bacterium]